MIDASKLKRIEDCKGRIKEIVGNDGVISLAKDGICPHYIIKNPITEEETIWFIPSELNQWFDNNYIRYNKGYFTPSFQFIHFNKDAHRVKGKVPPELSKIFDLYELPIDKINTPPGIYFLCKEGKIQYIGKASNVATRVLTHISEGIKDFNTVYFITCPLNELTELETALIRYFQPPLNGTCKTDPSKEDVMIIDSL